MVAIQKCHGLGSFVKFYFSQSGPACEPIVLDVKGPVVPPRRSAEVATYRADSRSCRVFCPLRTLVPLKSVDLNPVPLIELLYSE